MANLKGLTQKDPDCERWKWRRLEESAPINERVNSFQKSMPTESQPDNLMGYERNGKPVGGLGSNAVALPSSPQSFKKMVFWRSCASYPTGSAASEDDHEKALTGMNAQQASLVTFVPSEQVALSAAGAARETAARATRARREVKAI